MARLHVRESHVCLKPFLMTSISVTPHRILPPVLMFEVPPSFLSDTLCSAPADEFVQQPRFDHPVHGVWSLRAAAGGGGRVHGLLADHGGGHHPAAEPEHGGEDGTALRPLESVLRGW